MAQVISLSIKGTKKAALLAYFEDQEEEDLRLFNQAKPLLKERLYEKIEFMTEEGRKVLRQREAEEMLKNGKDFQEIMEKTNISENKFIEIRDQLIEEDEL